MDIERQNEKPKSLPKGSLVSLSEEQSLLSVEIDLSVIFYNLALVSSAELANPEQALPVIESDTLDDPALLDRVAVAMRAFNDQPLFARQSLEKAAKRLDRHITAGFIEHLLSVADGLLRSVPGANLTQNFWTAERPKRKGRPPVLTPVNILIGRRGLHLRETTDLSWPNIAQRILEELRQRSQRDGVEDEAIQRLTTLLNTQKRDHVGTFVQRVAKQVKERALLEGE